MTKKRYGVYDKKKNMYIQFFEYPIQAVNFIKKRFNNSPNFVVKKKE